MMKYNLTSREISADILYLTLKPKKSGTAMSFQAGQYAAIGFTGANGRPTPMRCFSITNAAPTARVLQFAIRIDGDFTHALADVAIGSEMFVQGPYGDFTINEQYDRSVVMIAGGIGVTPFMSMIRTASESGYRVPMTLLYSYRTEHAIPFHDELRQLELRNPNLRVIMFVSNKTVAPNVPHMLSGRMTAQHINQVTTGNYVGSTYFVCGPKGFMQSTEAMLHEKGVNQDRIVSESFTQASKITIGNGYNIRKVTYAFASAVLVLGILSVAALDLSGYLPKHTASASTVQTSQTTSASANSGSSSANTSTASPAAGSSSSRSSTPTQTYQQPVTSVS